MIAPSLVWPAGLNVQDFLADTWQQRPMRMPAALAGFRSPLSPDELAGLACDEGVESRLVKHKDGTWSLRNGPFEESDLEQLETSDWSLLVQDVEKHLPELAQILDPFRFLPSWRMDDLMISCAAPGGSVGPHVDAYDVFLIQAQGRRRWQWDSKTRAHHNRENSELSLVETFTPDEEWITGPGDVLYLPPGVAHFGVAMPDDELCMTYSIGFRAPSCSEILQDLALRMAESPESGFANPRYADPGISLNEAADGVISPAALARVRNMLGQALSMDDHALAGWFGSMVTEPKAWLQPLPNEESITPSQLIALLEKGLVPRRHGMALWAHWQGDDQVVLFIDGRSIHLDPELAPLARDLCSQRELNLDGLTLRNSPKAAKLVTDLVNAGELELDNE